MKTEVSEKSLPLAISILPSEQLTIKEGSTAHYRLAQDLRKELLLPTEIGLISDFADQLGQALKMRNIFKKENAIVIPKENGEGLREIQPLAFRTWVEEFVVCRLPSRVHAINKTMSNDMAGAVLASMQFRRHLREIQTVHPVRLPVIRADGRLELLSPGYDPESKTFTTATLDYPTDLPFSEAKALLAELFSEFQFTDASRSRAVAISAMLTPFGINLLHEGAIRPCFVYLANSPGAGKTTAAQLAIVPISGDAKAQSYSHESEELRRVIVACLKTGSTYLFFDNVKGELKSPALEALLTAPTYSDRQIRTSEMIEEKNRLTVFITGNGLTVSLDMRRRSLLVELICHSTRPEDRRFKQEMSIPVMLEKRSKILAAMFACVREWHAAGRPAANRTNSSFPEWSKTIAGIVECCGFGDPLEPAKTTAVVDDDGESMLALVQAMEKGKRYKPDEIWSLCIGRELFAHRMTNDRTVKSDKIALGKYFSGRNQMTFEFGETPVRFQSEGAMKDKRYWIEAIS